MGIFNMFGMSKDDIQKRREQLEEQRRLLDESVEEESYRMMTDENYEFDEDAFKERVANFEL